MRADREPDAQGAPVRRFRDPAYRPMADKLAGVRAEIDRLDDETVRLLAERAMYVKDAASFKRDAFQVSAPARQAQVFERVRALAEPGTPEQFAAYMRGERDKWGPVIKRAGIKAD